MIETIVICQVVMILFIVTQSIDTVLSRNLRVLRLLKYTSLELISCIWTLYTLNCWVHIDYYLVSRKVREIRMPVRFNQRLDSVDDNSTCCRELRIDSISAKLFLRLLSVIKVPGGSFTENCILLSQEFVRVCLLNVC